MTKARSQTNRVFLSSLLWLVGQEEWDELCRQLKVVPLDGDSSPMTLLTFCIHRHAPLHVISGILKLYPSILASEECNRQQLPFRVAAHCNSPLQTRILLEASRQGAIVRTNNRHHDDDDGILEDDKEYEQDKKDCCPQPTHGLSTHHPKIEAPQQA